MVITPSPRLQIDGSEPLRLKLWLEWASSKSIENGRDVSTQSPKPCAPNSRRRLCLSPTHLTNTRVKVASFPGLWLPLHYTATMRSLLTIFLCLLRRIVGRTSDLDEEQNLGIACLLAFSPPHAERAVSAHWEHDDQRFQQPKS